MTETKAIGIFDIVTEDLFDERVKEGYINVNHHPDFQELSIANYADSAAYDNVWDEATIACRGLIFNNETNEVVARPFPKFFNYENHTPGTVEGWMNKSEFLTPSADGESTSSMSYRAYEKHDGSLGIGYLGPDGHPAISTRGSFASTMAEWSTMWLDETGSEYSNRIYSFAKSCLADGVTPLFEIVYPENRIVRNYWGFEGLLPLGSIDMATGQNTHHYEKVCLEVKYLVPIGITLGPVKTFAHSVPMEDALADLLADVDERDLNEGNVEGWVFEFRVPDNGHMVTKRIKLKTEQYRNLHYIVTGWTMGSGDLQSRVLKALLAGADLEALESIIPQDLYFEIRQAELDVHMDMARAKNFTSRNFLQALKAVKSEVNDPAITRDMIANEAKYRKMFIVRSEAYNNSELLMSMLDGKDIDWLIFLKDHSDGSLYDG